MPMAIHRWGPGKAAAFLWMHRAVVPTQDGTRLQTTFSGHNTHGSLQLINDQYYVFYHRAPRGFGNARQSMVAPVKVESDEKPVSEGGKVTIRGYDPYAKDNVWTAKEARAMNIPEPKSRRKVSTSTDLIRINITPRDTHVIFPTSNSMQDSWDMWDNNMPLANVQNGNIIGYKYFGFGGLDKDRKGLKAFEGTKPGNNTAFNLFLAPKTTNAFKVNVWLGRTMGQ